MKIGELSKRTGVSIRMLRYYEGEGLLKPRRSESGYRDYEASEELIVERIKLLGSGGMTLKTIQQFLPCIRGDAPVLERCDELLEALRSQITALDEKRSELRRSRRVLQGFLSDIE